MFHYKFFLDFCKKQNNLLIYGDGNIGRTVRVFLEERGFTVSSFVVTNQVKPHILMGIEVRCINDYVTEMLSLEYQSIGIIICMNEKNIEEAKKKLTDVGLNNYFIVNDMLFQQIFIKSNFLYKYDKPDKKINTLMYHRVGSFEKDPFELAIDDSTFEEQVKHLKENYTILKSDDRWSDIDEKSVILTFDDGYVDFYSKVYPVLKKYNVPATVFISTGNMDTYNEFWWDELEKLFLETSMIPEEITIIDDKFLKGDYSDNESLLFAVHKVLLSLPHLERKKINESLKKQFNLPSYKRDKYRVLTRDEIVKLADDPLITIGAHTVSHIVCDKENEDVQRREIIESKEKLEEIIKKPVSVFAYPNGGYNERTQEILSECGFIRAFTVELGCADENSPQYQIPRNVVKAWKGKKFEAVVRGMFTAFKTI